MDAASSMLIAQLHLCDIETIKSSRTTRNRNKDDDLTDEELALRLQEDEYSSIVDNFKFALSINEAMERDREILDRMRLIEQGASDDHRYAEALSRGEALPQQSDAQRALEDPSFHREIRTSRYEAEDDKLEYMSEPGTPPLRPQVQPRPFVSRSFFKICIEVLTVIQS
ncbi:hypothetical protein VKT23_019804 [Stygiomarasmius scandens]|uniref:Uncharacterized protein n=1 Tax=Marasmiellus scandens TaxID=2682957 RepID=A0ABR1IN87_9AGAR